MQKMVSVIVASYNPDWLKMKVTLESILLQKGIDYEIIVADDGSNNNLKKNIEDLFEKYNFNSYKLSMLEENVGTCRNIFSALQVSEGKYIKTISPGDFLYCEDTLRQWVEYMDKYEDIDISFGDYINYRFEGGNFRIISSINHPKHKDVFIQSKQKNIFIDYLLLDDLILGAALLVKSAVIKKYLAMIVGKVIYVEDNYVRLAVYENAKLGYFAKPTIFYELGTGISTSGSVKWAERMKKDFISANRVIYENCTAKNTEGKKYKKYIAASDFLYNRLYKALFFPMAVWLKLREMKYYSQTMIDNDSFAYLLEYSEE